MFFGQMPAARPHEQDGGAFVEPIFFSLRIGESDCAANRVAQIDLAFHHVVPGRRVGVLEIGHENFRAGIERVDHHFAISRPGDLHSAVLQIARNRRAAPIAFANVFGFR